MVYLPSGNPVRSSCPFSTPPPAGTFTAAGGVLRIVFPVPSRTAADNVPLAGSALYASIR